MQQLLAVLLLTGCLHAIHQQIVEEDVQLVLYLEVIKHLLSESEIHPEYIVDDLDGDYGQAEDGLGQHLGEGDGLVLRGGLERLVPGEEDGRDHGDDAE